MKKPLFLLLMLLTVLGTSAQYEPNTHWPYIYENFRDGTIYSSDSSKTVGKFNIHLMGNVLHYIGDDGRIYQGKDNKVVRVEIGSDAYLFSSHRLMQVMAVSGTNVLVKMVKANFDRVSSGSSGGAYGADLNSSATHNFSSLDLGGLNTPELGLMLQNKHDGLAIPVSDTYYFLIGGIEVEANKAAVEKYLGEEKTSSFRKFVKEKKIKWKKVESLKVLLDYFSQS